MYMYAKQKQYCKCLVVSSHLKNMLSMGVIIPHRIEKSKKHIQTTNQQNNMGSWDNSGINW